MTVPLVIVCPVTSPVQTDVAMNGVSTIAFGGPPKHNPSPLHRVLDRRMKVGLIAVAAGFALAGLEAITAAPLHAITSQVPPAAAVPSWSTWIEPGSNFIKLVQMVAFVFGAYQFWANRKERLAADVTSDAQARKDANYQAWQVVNAAQGKGGSGGRIDALADLARNRVSLAGVNLDGAWLEAIDLQGAILPQASLRGSNLQASQLRRANLERADLTDANLTATKFDRAHLKAANLSGARLSAASLEGADLTDVTGWRQIRSISHASVRGVLNAPVGFVEWAVMNGAVGPDSDAPLEHSEFSREFRAI